MISRHEATSTDYFVRSAVRPYVCPSTRHTSQLAERLFLLEALFNILNLAKYIWTPWTGFSECTISCDTVPGVPKSLPYQLLYVILPVWARNMGNLLYVCIGIQNGRHIKKRYFGRIHEFSRYLLYG